MKSRERIQLPSDGYLVAAATMAICCSAPTAMANEVEISLAPQSNATAQLTATYDRSSRILFIGAQPIPAGEAALVTMSRASDLVGRPIDLRKARRSDRTASFVGGGGLPTSTPVTAAAVSSGFGMRAHPLLGGVRAHRGVDFAARHGSPVVATSDGMVSAADWNGSYGLFVALEHGGGVQTRYAHMSRLAVRPGEAVQKGDVIGYVGSTGRSTGPHLHYEVRVNGNAVNPAPLLRKK